MKNLFTILGVIILVAGAAIGNFSTIPFASYIGIFGEVFGTVLTIIGVWKKAEKKGWKEAVSILCYIVSAICFASLGVPKDVAIQIATAVVGLVVLITGLIVTFKKTKA